MSELLMGTTNEAKVSQVRDCLSPLSINVVGVKDKSLLPHVEEDGQTVLENARKKAVVYAKTFGRRVISMDNALYVDGLPDSKQPGMHVRRLNGKDAATDDELLENGVDLINSLGKQSIGYWEYGICLADPDGQFWETTIKTPRIFTSTPSAVRVEGYPLESIQIDPESGKYISEMSDDERALFWQQTIGRELVAFVETIN